MLIQRLARLMNRRSPPKTPSAVLLTWESELRAIAAEASAWSIETGGDLFGRWKTRPRIILLATKAGPNAERSNAHFRLDVEYLRELSETLATDWALRYFSATGIPITDWAFRLQAAATRSAFTALRAAINSQRWRKLS